MTTTLDHYMAERNIEHVDFLKIDVEGFDKFVLDGFPRTPAQAEALGGMLVELEAPLEACLLLEVDEEELVKRLLERARIEGRSDDNEEAIRNRMRVYREQTEPLVAHYEGLGLLRRVAALGTIDEVEKRIEEALS